MTEEVLQNHKHSHTHHAIPSMLSTSIEEASSIDLVEKACRGRSVHVVRTIRAGGFGVEQSHSQRPLGFGPLFFFPQTLLG